MNAVTTPVMEDRPTLHERVLALALTSVCFVLVYTGSNRVAAMRGDAGLCLFDWEASIPFVSWMIFPYWSLDLFFVGAPFVCRTRAELRLLAFRLCFAIAVAGVFFVTFPLRLAFPTPPTSGATASLFRALDAMGDFHNLAPSLHIAIWSILLAVYLPILKGLRRALLLAWFGLIAVSTVLCFRHHVIDLFTGGLLGLATMHLFSPAMRGVNAERDEIGSNIPVGVAYLLGTFLFVLASAASPPATIFFLWPAVSLGIVGVAYLGFGAAFLGKNDGEYALSTRILLLPYQLGALASALLQGRRLPPFVELTPEVILGRLPIAGQRARVSAKKFAAVLDLTAEHPFSRRIPGVTYKNIPVLDLTAPSPAQLREAVAFIRENEREGPVYIHCALGRSRTSVVAAAYLLSAKGFRSVDQAVRFLRERHPHAVLRDTYLRTLEQFLVASNERAETTI